MSEGELAYMMTDSNDGYDLPRWIDPQQPAQYFTPSIPQQRTGQLSSSSPSRPPRIAQLVDNESSPTFVSSGLARSASLSNNLASRTRRHHQPDDLEFNTDRSFYPASVGYQPIMSSVSSPDTVYYSKRQQNEPPRSPLRGPNTPLDMYTSYSPYTENRHNRSQSQAKSDPLTPPTPSVYSPSSYAMDTSTQSLSVRKNSVSNPSTPMSYLHPSHSPSYYPQDQPMVLDVPPKHRAPGFRRVRTVHDLQPRLDIPTTGRRMASDGTFLSVSAQRRRKKQSLIHL